MFDFHHKYICWVPSQFYLLSFITIWVFELHYSFLFWVSSQFEFLSFIIILVFEFHYNFSFLSFITLWAFRFHHDLIFKVWVEPSSEPYPVSDWTNLIKETKKPDLLILWIKIGVIAGYYEWTLLSNVRTELDWIECLWQSVIWTSLSGEVWTYGKDVDFTAMHDWWTVCSGGVSRGRVCHQ